MLRNAFVVALLVLCASTAGGAATQGGPLPGRLPLFPPHNWWNVDVSAAPLDPNSPGFITFIGTTRIVHPDFGGDDGEGGIYGIPYIVVDGSQPKKTVTFLYDDESDGNGVPFYPIPDEAITQNGWIEGGPPGTSTIGGDRHVLIVDATNNLLYELFDVFYNGTAWEAGSGAFFDMNTNNRRPETWTSADAAGLAVLPGLVRYDEAYGEAEIRHAFRVTVQATNGHVFPASHTAGDTIGALPMGARLRLKANKNISTYAPQIQRIFRAFKKYGLIVADNGSNMYVSGTYDTRWDNDILNPAFHSLTASDFEVVQLGWTPPVSFVLAIPQDLGAGDAASATLTAYDSANNVATGYNGTVQFTSTDGAATLPLNYTFTAGDAGVRAFPSGFILRTAGHHVITVTDTSNNTGSRGVIVGPSTPTALQATANGTTSVSLSWNPSAGAAQYEVVRLSLSGATVLPATALTSATDMNVAAGNFYLYAVRAIDAASRRSPLSAPDLATTFVFSEGVVAGMTTIKAQHFDELRTVANALRSFASLGPATFTDPTLGGVFVKRAHVEQLRTAIVEARSALGLLSAGFTDPVLTVATPVKAAHVQELRDAMR